MQPRRQFSEFPEISKESLQVLTNLEFENATPVQDATIPLFTGNKDVAVDACTGSGKTLAFLIPVIERLRKLETPLKSNSVGAVIVSPTRELARQIFRVAQPFIETISPYKSLLLVGGNDVDEDIQNFNQHGGHILIGTPGRMEDIMKQCTDIDLKSVEVLVLDEADRLLDMGFQAQLNSIMQMLPRQRRTGLFSATQTEAVEVLIRAGLRNPIRVNVAVTSNEDPSKTLSQKTPDGLRVQYNICSEDEKMNQLYQFLLHYNDRKVIVYFLTCASVDYHKTLFAQVWEQQKRQKGKRNEKVASQGFGIKKQNKHRVFVGGLEVFSLHGRLKQSKREKTLQEFEQNQSGAALFCTDIAARGLDIPDVHWIVQFDPPQDPSSFVHRAGRTARMGRSGDALVYLLSSEKDYIQFLSVRKVPMTVFPKFIGKEQRDDGQQQEDVRYVEHDNYIVINARQFAESDRDVMEKGKKAFVSFVRGYKEHHCRFIFRLEELNAAKLGNAFGLLLLPKMPEITRLQNVREFENSSVDVRTIPFKDKVREKQRQKAILQKAKDSNLEKQQKSKEGKRERRDQQVIQAVNQLPKRQRNRLLEREEMKFLDDEYRLLKKLKRRKISEREFDEATGMLAIEAEKWEETQQKKNNMVEQFQIEEIELQEQTKEDNEAKITEGGELKEDQVRQKRKLGQLKKAQVQRRRVERYQSLVSGKFLKRIKKKHVRKIRSQFLSQQSSS